MPGTPASPTASSAGRANAVQPAVRPSEASVPSPSAPSSTRLTSRCRTGFSLGGGMRHTASSAARRLPIQPSPASSTPTSPIRPTPARASMAPWIASLSVVPAWPGSFAATRSNSVCNAAGCAESRNPATETASSSSGNSARKLM